MFHTILSRSKFDFKNSKNIKDEESCFMRSRFIRDSISKIRKILKIEESCFIWSFLDQDSSEIRFDFKNSKNIKDRRKLFPDQDSSEIRFQKFENCGKIKKRRRLDARARRRRIVAEAPLLYKEHQLTTVSRLSLWAMARSLEARSRRSADRDIDRLAGAKGAFSNTVRDKRIVGK